MVERDAAANPMVALVKPSDIVTTTCRHFMEMTAN